MMYVNVLELAAITWLMMYVMSVRHVIQRFGGVRPLARALGHPNPSTVAGWNKRSVVPWHEVERVIEAGALRGITVGLEEFLPETNHGESDDLER